MDLYFNPWHIWSYLAGLSPELNLTEALMLVGVVGIIFTRVGAPQAELLPEGWEMTIHCSFLALILATASAFRGSFEVGGVTYSERQPEARSKTPHHHHHKKAA